MIHDPDMAISAARQLGAMINRAQDERFRLMRMAEEYQARLDAIPEPVSADHIDRLLDSIGRLNAAISQRMGVLSELDATIEHRLDQLAKLEASMSQLTRRMAGQIQEAREFNARVETAKRQIRAATAAAKAESEGHPRPPAEPRMLACAEDPRPLRALAARLNAKTG